MIGEVLIDVRSQDIGSMLGVIGTICWSFRLLFHLYSNYRRKKVLDIDGVNLLVVVLLPGTWIPWMFCQMFTGIVAAAMKYCTVLAIQPHIVIFASLFLLGQMMIYECKLSKLPAFFILITLTLPFSWFGMSYLTNMKGWNLVIPDLLGAHKLAIISLVFVASGWVPPYIENAKHQGRAVSISWVALTFGMCGALNLMSAMSFQQPVLGLSIALYGVMLALDTGLLIAHIVWLMRTRKVRSFAKSQGKTFDELASDYAKHGLYFQFAASRKWTLAEDIPHSTASTRARTNTFRASVVPQRPERAYFVCD